MHRYSFIAIMLIVIVCSSCFSRFVMTERELNTYYKDKEKPVFFTIENDSVELYCATSGADTLPPLLLIHGAPGAWYGSRNFLEDDILKQHYHIIAVDRLGYNKSRFKGKRKAVTSITTQAIAINEALRLNRSFKTGVVLGSSYGAPIATKLAVLYPEKFHHLIMLAPSIDPDREVFWWFHRYVQQGSITRLFIPHFLNVATDEKFAHVQELKKMLPDWSKLSIPVTVVQGGEDDIVDPGNLDFAKKQLQGKKAEFLYLPEAGHLIRWRNREVVRSILLNDLQGTNSY